MTSSITVRGGTSATRQKILYDRSNEIIVQFLDEGNSNPTPIQYTLTPVWQILGEKQEYRVQATNLKYYFDGFLNFGCDYIKGIHKQMIDDGSLGSLFLLSSTPQHFLL
jgi:hypothetical protein